MGEHSEIQENPPPDSGIDPISGEELADSLATSEEVSLLPDEEILGKPKDEKEEQEEEEVARQLKRRKTSCPSAIDTGTPVAKRSGALPSFSFDTRIQPMYSTPKFGAFSMSNLGTSDLQELTSAQPPKGDKDGNGEAGVEPEAKLLVELGSVDGGDATKDEQ